jgi:glutamate-ammonia-ligase adenylyltransferase
MNLIYKDFDTLPEVVKHTSIHNQARLREKTNGTIKAQLDKSQVEQLHVLLGLSDFIAETFIAHPEWIPECLPENSVPEGHLRESKQSADKQPSDKKTLETLLTDITDEHQLHRVLRQFRNKRMVQIASADLLNVQSIEDSLTQVSQLADALIVAGYEWLYRWFCRKYNVPTGSHGPQNLLIIGMGKLGGRELNFSSDIDLIFAYPEKGELEYRNKSMEHQQFFTKLAQKLIAALHQTTADGQVFRVDMRLRPFGDSGPLAASFAALEDYYQEQGREWERYAMVKGRILNEYDPYAPDLEGILRPFGSYSLRIRPLTMA